MKEGANNLLISSKIKWAISVAAILIVLLRVFVPGFFDRIDAIALGLLGIAILPWLSAFVKSFSIPGVIEAELRELRLDVEEAKTTATEAQTSVADARVDSNIPTKDLESKAVVPKTKGQKADLIEKLDELGEHYLSTRASMKPGPVRSDAMTKIFRDMRELAQATGFDKYPVEQNLASKNAGQNLTAIAMCYAFPNSVSISDVAACVGNSNQPFVQYWGLMVVRKVLRQVGITPFTPNDIMALNELQNVVGARTDRSRVIGYILAKIKELT